MERTKQDRNETPVGVSYSSDGQGSLTETGGIWRNHNLPDNEYEALMECAPLQEPQSHHETSAGWDAMLDKVLTPKEKAVIELLYIGGMSGTEAGIFLARQFSSRNKPYTKTYVYKLRDQALAKLRNVLEET